MRQIDSPEHDLQGVSLSEGNRKGFSGIGAVQSQLSVFVVNKSLCNTGADLDVFLNETQYKGGESTHMVD